MEIRRDCGLTSVMCGGSGAKAPPLATRPLFLRSYQTYTTTRRYSTCQLRLTLHKLTGWLASLDLRKPHASRILSHQIGSRDPPRLIPLSTNTQGSLVP